MRQGQHTTSLTRWDPVYQVPSSVLLQLTAAFAAKSTDFKPLSTALSQLSVEANQPVQLAVFASAFRQAAGFVDKASAAHVSYLVGCLGVWVSGVDAHVLAGSLPHSRIRVRTVHAIHPEHQRRH